MSALALGAVAALFGVVTSVLARPFLAEATSARRRIGVAVAFSAIGRPAAG